MLANCCSHEFITLSFIVNYPIMRLLCTAQSSTGHLEMRDFTADNIPKYAILSHRWDEEEITLQDVENGLGQTTKGYKKVERCCARARADGFQYVWIDTCCIDKTSSAELSEAINSMYRWYWDAAVCYAYLADVPTRHAVVSDSLWFSRGWTLQELIAPPTVIFLDEQWRDLGTKETLEEAISSRTLIPASVLRSGPRGASIAQRMSWAAGRQTTRLEDQAYCLLGIFEVNMPLLYGEGERAFIRLQEEIMKISDDQSLFAWRSDHDHGGMLATEPAAFRDSSDIIPWDPPSSVSDNGPLTVTSKGVHMALPFIGVVR